MKCLLCVDGTTHPFCKAVLYPGAVRDIVRCENCGGAYYDPVPPLEEVARCYPHAYFRDFFKQYWKDYYKGRLLAEDLQDWRPEGTVLDVGCALGTMLAGVRDHSKRKVLGLEYSPAAAKAGKEVNKVDIAPGGLSQAPYEAGSIDFININNVLEHERDPALALTLAAKLLSKGGRLRLAVPNGPIDLRATSDLWAKLHRPVVTRHGGHLFFMTKKSLGALFKRSGLRILSAKNFHFKLGAKARGWTKNPYRAFLEEPPPVPADESAGIPVEKLKTLIPPPPSWALYKAGARWRRLFRCETSDFGYDYEMLAEKA
ncbi:class I SAM-dependent methyltransferase [bacterium]|nr:MAG: class I SAM-dependent methyltransferase [bacterium]